MSQQQTISPRRAATRQRLLTAATTVIAERGVNGASVEAICEEAGFTRGAFYSNFATKEDLLHDLMVAKHAGLLDGIRRILDETDQAAPTNGVELIEDVVEKVLAANPVDRQSRLVDAEIGLFIVRNPELAPPLMRAMAPFREGLARLLVEGLERAGRRLVVDLDDAVNAIFAAYEAGSTWSTAAHDEAENLETCRRTLSLVIKAVSEPTV
ncbi:TetR/AcrR family transcriptional regulator [Kineosporia sp. J2-2]|uniref:TetR/AcrR family transcriptional regulator n=1 Tax=Kineosporia corallincola TaxID=2835133 RepID=A0ABS5TBF9_9ACTN|nr:TetR/AcrR family transcriptional regulator [Kineosporia corallincola]MBT0767546.1 TetR/AcrR family transcriptional regulator [Kineosporia corallincola]